MDYGAVLPPSLMVFFKINDGRRKKHSYKMAEKVILISCLPSKFKQKQAPKLFSSNQNIPFKKSNIPFEKSRKKSGGWGPYCQPERKIKAFLIPSQYPLM